MITEPKTSIVLKEGFENRIAGIYDSNDNSIHYLGKGEWHNITDEDYINGKIRFSIQNDNKITTLDISGIKKENMIDCLKSLLLNHKDIIIDRVELSVVE